VLAAARLFGDLPPPSQRPVSCGGEDCPSLDPQATIVPVFGRLPHVAPMLATLVSQPFHRGGWVFEEKVDG